MQPFETSDGPAPPGGVSPERTKRGGGPAPATPTRRAEEGAV